MAFLDTASSWLTETLDRADGVEINYRRGAATLDLTAVVGQTPLGFDLGAGIVQSWQATDFLIKAEDLVFSGEEVLPAVGAIITQTIRDNEVQFEVLLADDGNCYRYCDGTREVLRVHTREVSRRLG